MPRDAVYSLTKHAVVGFVRSVAPHLEPVRINAVCPGIADTPMIDAQRGAFAAAGFPLLAPDEVAEAVWRAATSGDRRSVVRPARSRAGAVPLPERAGPAERRRAGGARRSEGVC